MSIKNPARSRVADLPDPGEGRFWAGVHRPNSVKEPLLLELREKTVPSAEHTTLSMSTLIAKAGTVADEDAIVETAKEILTRANRVKDFVGILQHG